jgi:hypothetical protein
MSQSSLEKRKHVVGQGVAGNKSTDLPHDFRKMVREVFATQFDETLQAIKKHRGEEAEFEIFGAIFADEIRLTACLSSDGHGLPTSVHASADFDPKASSPTAEDIIGACVDGVGSIFQQLTEDLTKERIDELFGTLDDLGKDVPFEWTKADINKLRIYFRVDKANPGLDQAAEDWLAKNDPRYQERLEEEAEETEALFIRGPKKPNLH